MQPLTIKTTDHTGQHAKESPLFPPLPFDLPSRAHKALADEQLQRFVNRATYSKDSLRKEVFRDAFGDRYGPLRDLAGSIKQHTLDHLDFYLEQFTERAQAAGATVHFALDSKEANDICLDIARQHNCKLCVKSKSMVTEETHLVPELQAIGCETVETDLGEFIVQLDGDAPSHIVSPMIHKDRTAVGRAFTRELGVPYTEDPTELTMIARGYLRDKYRKADLGISGGNFLIAQTGSITVCTNEGNARFCTSAPRVHVAFVGIEKLIPRLDHLAVFLKLLARSATGQALTIYTHTVTGPRRAEEHDGPEEVHIILLDNGRTRALMADTREMLRCIRCGACLNACPVYRKIGGHSYGGVYSGPIGAILTPMLKGLENYPDLPHASSLCGACFDACPVRINIPKYLVQHRTTMNQVKLTKWTERLAYRAWAASLLHPMSYRLGIRAQRTMFNRRADAHAVPDGADPYSHRAWVRELPGPLAGWTSQRDMPGLPAKSFRDWWIQEGRK